MTLHISLRYFGYARSTSEDSPTSSGAHEGQSAANHERLVRRDGSVARTGGHSGLDALPGVFVFPVPTFLCQLSCGNRGARFRRGGSGGFRAKWIGRSELTRSASDRTAEAAANAARQISQLGNVGRVDLAVRHRGKFLKAGERGFRRLSRLEFRQCRGYGFVLRLDLHSLFAPIESPSVPR